MFRYASVILLLSLSPLAAQDAAALKPVLAAIAARDWATAQAAADSPLAADLVQWHYLRAGDGKLGEYEAFLTGHPDWPGLALLREKGEAAVARSADPARVIAYFGALKPQTATGSLALITALSASGRAAEAEAEALRAWTELQFSLTTQAQVLALHGAALSVAHEVRLDRLLWAGDRGQEVRHMLPLVSRGWQALAEARLALRADKDGVTALINAVPADLADDPGLAYERFAWRMRKDLYPDAAVMILDRSTSAQSLGNPQAWAPRRANLARATLRDGTARDAYAIAANNHLTAGADYADLEFLAGFIALRKLGDADRALTHFNNLKSAVVTPISVARAHYWIGRALEAKGAMADATAAYQAAARHQTAYYGLLAAEELGLSLDESLLSDARPPSWKDASFATSSVLRIALTLVQAGDRTQAKRFFLHLAESLDATELDQLADLALQLNEPHIAVLIGKAAAERGLILPRAYFPTPDMVPDDLPVSRALALAIARRESEFDPAAQSSAGARGLMQVMPDTAKLVSRQLGLDYALGNLTADPAYNVTLGAAYLRKMADDFGPSVALIASGYNAGPRRPAAWITQFGDPRSAEVDIVDWVEMIPFAETRTYVMRVVEGVVIYRAKLKGAVGPVRISAELRG